MLRNLIALLCAVFISGSALAQEGKKLTIRWYGQSFFPVTTSAGTKIVFDPHFIEQYPREMVAADLVLISHPHADHSAMGRIINADKVKVLTGVKGTAKRQQWNRIDEKFRDAHIYSIGTFHDKDSGMTRGRNSCIIVEVDGLRICHLGDLGHELSERQLQSIGEVDILMVPIGGIYTINGTDAKKVVEQIKPKRLILPMHYGTKVFEDLVGPDEFIEGQRQVQKLPDTNEIEVKLGEKPPTSPRIVLLGWTKKKPGDD
jgi:L-ascorbate metabolism protein UlaG (beta-lactamase superfamily)